VAAWAFAPAVSEVRSVRDDVQRSEVLERLNAVLTPAGPRRQRKAPPPDLPQSAGRTATVAVREPRLLSDPAVKRADRSLVKIVITRCGDEYQGTGWIAGHGIVVTNAHVVSTAKRVSVMRGGKGRSLPATVVWFDGIHDVALLRVPLLRSAPGLPLADDPRPQTPGFSLGFPSGRKAIHRARLGVTTSELNLPTLRLTNKAGVSLTMQERLVTVIRGINGPGGSGGPMIDGHGRVLATVFAGIPQNGITLAVPNRIVRSAMRRAGRPVRVPACGDPPLKPTPRQSIAARNA
jgi:S1-C subfamily serine protease